MARLAADAIADLNQRFLSSPPEVVLRWAIETYHPAISLASSFGAEDMVLIHMLAKLRPGARVFTLETGRLHQETYDLMDEVRRRYPIRLEPYAPATRAVEAMVADHGANLFYRAVELRKLCCGVRKVEPVGRALRGLEAWITGLRREQAASRAAIEKIEVDEDHGGIVKLNPLADWDQDQVWAYLRHHEVPYNRLHDQGFPSIGCAPCTRAVLPGDDPRAGRWWWEQDGVKECGLHLHKSQDGRGGLQKADFREEKS